MPNSKDQKDTIQLKDLKNTHKTVRVNPKEQPHRAKTVLGKVNDLTKITLTISEIAVLKARYHIILNRGCVFEIA